MKHNGLLSDLPILFFNKNRQESVFCASNFLTIDNLKKWQKSSLADTDAAVLGFNSQENFDNTGTGLTGDVAFDFTSDFTVTGALLISLGAAKPKLLDLNFEVTGADAGNRRFDFKTELNMAIDAVFGGGQITADLTGGDKVELTPDDGASSLEITRSVTMSAEFSITLDELAHATIGQLFSTTPDAVNDNFEIDLTLNVKDENSKIVVNPADGLDGRSLNITADLIVDNGGTIEFPLQNDLVQDYTDLWRFDLGDYLKLNGVELSSFDPETNPFQDVLDFNVIGAAEVVNLVGQLKGWLDRLPNAEILGGFDIPFAETTVGDLFDFADLIQDYVLRDDWDDDDPDTNTDRLVGIISDLDEDILSVTFATAQELATRLSDLGLLPGGVANYKMSRRELTYDIKVDAFGPDLTAPIDFELDLEPLTDVSVVADVNLYSYLTFEATLGIDLSSSKKIDLTTTLDELNNNDGVPIKTGLALTGAEDASIIYGQISDDATFSISINDGAAVEVRVFKTQGPTPFDPGTVVAVGSDELTLTGHGLASGDAVVYSNGGGSDIGGLVDGTTYFIIKIDNNTIQLATTFAEATASTPVPIELTSVGAGVGHSLLHDHDTDDNVVTNPDDAPNPGESLLEDINAALAAGGLGAQIEAVEIDERIVLQAKNLSVNTFEVFADRDDPAFTDLGLLNSAASTVFLTGIELSNIPLMSGIGSFKIEVNDDGNEHLIKIDELEGNRTVNDLVRDLNVELQNDLPDDYKGKIMASRSGNRLVLAAVDGSINVFRIADAADATETERLGLAASQLENEQVGGIFHSQVAGVFVIGENFLDKDINEHVTTGSAFGRLTNNVSFNVSLNDGEFTGTISVNAGETDKFTEMSELIKLINDTKIATEVESAELKDRIKVVQLDASHIALRAISDEVEKIEITSDAVAGLING